MYICVYISQVIVQNVVILMAEVVFVILHVENSQRENCNYLFFP
jgi:hypothetical protein